MPDKTFPYPLKSLSITAILIKLHRPKVTTDIRHDEWYSGWSGRDLAICYHDIWAGRSG